MQNEADATYCSKCSLVLDEKVLYAKQTEEVQTDALMDELMQHPEVQQAIKNAVKELWTQGKFRNYDKLSRSYPKVWFTSSITSYTFNFELYFVIASDKLRSQNGQAETIASTPSCSASFILSPEISTAHSG